MSSLRPDLPVVVKKLEAIDDLPWKQRRVAGVADLDVAKHLTYDAFQMLVVEKDSGRTEDPLYFVNEIARGGLGTKMSYLFP